MPVLIAACAFVMTLVGGIVPSASATAGTSSSVSPPGSMLGVVGFDLLPEALETQPRLVFGVPSALLMFVAGFLGLHIIERSVAIHRAHEGEYARTPTGTGTPTNR